jgi:hypothetical protein
LKPGIGISSKIFPVKSEGAILEFSLGSGAKNDDEYMPSEETVNVILKKIEQNLVGGNIDAIKFGGTNISMERDRILLIKGEDAPSEWSDEGARKDVKRILTTLPKR